MDGSGEPRTITRDPWPIEPNSVSPDGKWVACTTLGADRIPDLTLISIETGERRSLVTSKFAEWLPAFSPDGRWLAYASNESGRGEIYVRSAAPGGGRWQVSTDGGNFPAWSHDGKAIYFAKVRSHIFRAEVEPAGGVLNIGNPVTLMDATRFNDAFDVAPDGSIIGVFRPLGSATAGSIQYVENWGTDLERRLPK